METYSASTLTELFPCSYKTALLQERLIKIESKRALPFKFTFRFVDGVITINDPKIGDYADKNVSFQA